MKGSPRTPGASTGPPGGAPCYDPAVMPDNDRKPPSDGDQRPCVFKACPGKMTFSASHRTPGSEPTRLSDGTFKSVGTVRPMWICDRNPHHIQVDGLSA